MHVNDRSGSSRAPSSEAASCSGGGKRPAISPAVTNRPWRMTSSPATKLPPMSLTGTASVQSRASICWLAKAKVDSRTSRSAARNLSGDISVCSVYRVEPRCGPVPVDLVRPQLREHHLADRRAIRRQPPAHVEPRRHDARGRRASDVHDLVAIEYRERARLVQFFAEPIQDRLRQHGERGRRQVGMAERQHARPQVEPARVVGRDEANFNSVCRLRRAAARGIPARWLTCAIDIRRFLSERASITASPRASAVTKSGSLPNGAMVSARLRRIRRPRDADKSARSTKGSIGLKDIGFARHEGSFRLRRESSRFPRRCLIIGQFGATAPRHYILRPILLPDAAYSTNSCAQTVRRRTKCRYAPLTMEWTAVSFVWIRGCKMASGVAVPAHRRKQNRVRLRLQRVAKRNRRSTR